MSIPVFLIPGCGKANPLKDKEIEFEKISTEIEKSLLKAFRIAAVSRDLSIKDAIAEAMAQWIEQRTGWPAPGLKDELAVILRRAHADNSYIAGRLRELAQEVEHGRKRAERGEAVGRTGQVPGDPKGTT